jgi:hypothetical protein
MPSQSPCQSPLSRLRYKCRQVALVASPAPTPLPNRPRPHHYCFGFALSLALALVPCLVLDGANVAVSPPSTIAVAIAVPVAIPDTITIAFPPRQNFLN